MPREANLFEAANGSVVDGYFLLRDGGGNIPPNWIERASAARKNRQKALGKMLKTKSLDALPLLRDWEIAFRKEYFYHGLRALLEMERTGKTKY